VSFKQHLTDRWSGQTDGHQDGRTHRHTDGVAHRRLIEVVGEREVTKARSKVTEQSRVRTRTRARRPLNGYRRTFGRLGAT